MTKIPLTPSATLVSKATATGTATLDITSTAPAPLPPLPLMDPLPGLVFESYTMRGEGFPQDRTLWTIDASGKLVYLADGDEEQNLLSSDQRWLIHVYHVNMPSMDYSESQIWIEDRENHISRQLIPPQGCTINSDMISWSYDIKRLYYFVDCEKIEGRRDLWSLDLNTWESKNLTNSPDRSEQCFGYSTNCKVSFPSLPDAILMTSYVPSPPPPLGTPLTWETQGRLTEINSDGKDYRVLDSETGIFGYPSIAPDGHALAYDGGNILDKNGARQTLTYEDLDTTRMAANYIQPYVDIVNPAWSPDGTKIAWDIAHTDGDNQTKVAIFDLPTQTWNTLLSFEPYWWNVTRCPCDMWHVRTLEWSPDGQWLAFSNTEFPDNEVTYRVDMFYEEHASVWIFDRNGKKMFSMYGAMGQPTWSPDGNWLAIDAVSRDSHHSVTVIKVNEWKAYKVDLPFENVKLVDWLESR